MLIRWLAGIATAGYSLILLAGLANYIVSAVIKKRKS